MYIYRKPNQIVAISKPKVKINHIATSKPMPKTCVANNYKFVFGASRVSNMWRRLIDLVHFYGGEIYC